jgi:hypothetical protein
LVLFGPAWLTGVAILVPSLIVGLVLGVPLTIATLILLSAAWTAIARLVRARLVRARLVRARLVRAPRLGPPARDEAAGRGAAPELSSRTRLVERLGVLALTAYAVVGAVAMARAPTGGDDARIWSLRGLTLTYYGRLQPEIFLNQGQSGSHPVYPLFQPVLEAVLSRSVGYPALRLVHTELWLLFGAALWTAAYLLLRTRTGSGAVERIITLAPIVTLAALSIAVSNLVSGYADTTGSTLLAVGTLGLGLWIETDEPGCLFLAAILLTAAASTKDEDLLGALCVLVIGSLAALAHGGARGPARRHCLLSLAGLAAWFAVFVAPWRIWLKAHHLTDSVQPPLPRALEPSFLAHRTHQLNLTATAMLDHVLHNWDWLAAVFIVTAGACLLTGAARRVVAFYLGCIAVIVVALVWLYTTTPVSLAFLLPTSMGRTVSVFMAPAVVITAHLLRLLLDGRDGTGTEHLFPHGRFHPPDSGQEETR